MLVESVSRSDQASFKYPIETLMSKQLAVALPLLVMTLAGSALAQNTTYPSRSIRFVVPFASGGTTDIVARLVGAKLSEEFKQQLVIDNRGGAGSTIGTAIAASAPPDGYTMLLGNNGLAINASLYPNLSYDAQKSFVPISLVGLTPNVLVVNNALPANTVKEFIGLAKARPEKLAYASAGVGSSTHLPVVLFENLTGARFVHVPYKGGAPALTDTIAGQTQFMFATMPSVYNHIIAGKLRAIAVSGARRSPALPNVPTIAESELPNYEYTSWYGVLAPAGLPETVLRTLNEATVRVLNSPDLMAKLRQQGLEPEPTSPERFNELIRSETALWSKVIKASGLKVE